MIRTPPRGGTGGPAPPAARLAGADGGPVSTPAVSSLGPAAPAGDTRARVSPGPGTPARAGVPARRLPQVVLRLADAVALTAALVATGGGGRTVWPAMAYSAAALLSLSVAGVQRFRICARVSDQVMRILVALLVPALVLLPWTPAANALRLVLWAAGMVLGVRIVVTAAMRAARRRGYLTEPALVIGAGATGEQIAGLLREHPELGLRVCGFLDSPPLVGEASMLVLGGPADLAEVVTQRAISRVIVCLPDDRNDELAAVLRDRRELRADICVVPRRPELTTAVPAACLDEIWGIRLIPLRAGRAATSMLAKRVFDVAAAGLLLAAFAPLLAVLALAIRGRGRCPVFFRQARVVGGGRSAEIIKLRTMEAHADSDTCWVVPAQQLTSLGRWLRVTHLDELPQLINVLRGEMSLVGPRPERPFFAVKFGREIPRYDDRHRMRAGLTGLAQVHGLHGDTSIHERVRFDNLYIDNWSLWLDFVVLIRTLTTVAARGPRGCR